MIPIDEQIKYQREPWGSGEHESAITASLEELKRIREVQVPEKPVQAEYDSFDGYVDSLIDHIDTMRDLLRRESARANEMTRKYAERWNRAEAAEAKLAAIKEQSHD